MKKLLVLLALTAVVALAGACGSSEEGPSAEKEPAKAEKPTAVETVRVAYKETTAEQTAKTSFAVTTTIPPGGPRGAGQTAPTTMKMAGRGVTDFSGAASRTTTEVFGMGSFEMRQVEDTVYIKLPKELLAQMPGSKPWMRMDLDAMYGQRYGPGRAQDGMVQDPARQLEYLRGVSDSVEKVGEDRVRGVPTARYEAVVNLRKEAAGQDAEARKAYDEVIRELGTSKLPLEVWLDGQNRVRRYAVDVTVPMPENAASPNASREDTRIRTQMEIEYYDFGTAVNVQAPPPDQTTDGSKMFPGQRPVAQ